MTNVMASIQKTLRQDNLHSSICRISLFEIGAICFINSKIYILTNLGHETQSTSSVELKTLIL